MKTFRQIREKIEPLKESVLYNMTYLKGHKKADKPNDIDHYEFHHTTLALPKSDYRYVEGLGHDVKSNPKHKELIKKGYSIHKYGEHDTPKTYYSFPTKTTKSLDESIKDTLTKYDATNRPGFRDDKEIPNVIMLKRKAIRVYPDHQKVALYYAQSIDKYVTIPFGLGGESGIPMVREEMVSERAIPKSVIKKRQAPIKIGPAQNKEEPDPKKKKEPSVFDGGDGWYGIGYAMGSGTGKLIQPAIKESIVAAIARVGAKVFGKGGTKAAPKPKPRGTAGKAAGGGAAGAGTGAGVGRVATGTAIGNAISGDDGGNLPPPDLKNSFVIKPKEYNFDMKVRTSRAAPQTSQSNSGLNSPAQVLKYNNAMLRETVMPTLRKVIEDGDEEVSLKIRESVITINSDTVEKILSVYKVLTIENQLKMKTMLSESEESFMKVINFVLTR